MNLQILYWVVIAVYFGVMFFNMKHNKKILNKKRSLLLEPKQKALITNWESFALFFEELYNKIKKSVGA